MLRHEIKEGDIVCILSPRAPLDAESQDRLHSIISVLLDAAHNMTKEDVLSLTGQLKDIAKRDND